jgi:hypothetical protein
MPRASSTNRQRRRDWADALPFGLPDRFDIFPGILSNRGESTPLVGQQKCIYEQYNIIETRFAMRLLLEAAKAALDKNERMKEAMTKPPAEIVELREMGFSNDQILRMLELKMLELRGLVIRETLSDGSAHLHYPQPDHPEVKAFREAAGDAICDDRCACCGKRPKP